MFGNLIQISHPTPSLGGRQIGDMEGQGHFLELKTFLPFAHLLYAPGR